MRVIIKGTLLILFQLFVYNTIFAQSFLEININDGISSRTVIQSAKDADGYVWFVTKMGVDRFNGISTVKYQILDTVNSTSNKYKLNINYPKGITINSNNEIYTFTSSSIYKFSPKSNDFKLLYSNLGSDVKYNIFTIKCDSNGNILIGTNCGLYIINTLTNKVIKLLDSTQVYNFEFNNDSLSSWVATDTGVLTLRLNQSGTYSIDREIDLPAINNKRVQSLFYDNLTKQLWIGTFANGLYRYDIKSGSLDYSDISKHHIRVISIVDYDKIWIGIDGGGIYEFNRFNYSLRKVYSQTATKNNKIPTNSIYDIKDYGNFVMICTYKYGVLVFNKNIITQKVYQHLENDLNSISNNHINTILVDKRDRIWFGTDNGVSRYDKEGGSWQHFLKSKDSNNSVILSLMEDEDGSIWAGGYSCEIAVIDKNDNISNPLNNLRYNDIKRERYVYDITKDYNNNIWIGGVVDNLIKISDKTKEIKSYPINNIHTILPINDSLIIIATSNGLNIINDVNGTIKPLNSNIKEISEPSIQCLYRSKNEDDILWIGTEGYGVYRYNLKTKEIKGYKEDDGLSSNNICSIIKSTDNKLWVSTINGLNCIDLLKNNIYSISAHYGLINNTYTLRSISSLMNGNIIIGTPNGAFEINTVANLFELSQNNNLKFEEFALFNKPIYPNSVDSPLIDVIDKSSKIKLSYNQHSFSFKFINLSIVSMENSIYSWKLDGFDKEWSVPSLNNNAVYTNIPPGKYNFRVRCYNGNINMPMQEREIKILIKSPWWNSWYSWFIYLIILTAIIIIIIRLQKDKINAKISDQKIRFFIDIAHDIRTPLTLIKAPLSELETTNLSNNDVKSINIALNNTDKLLSIVNKLLNFQKIERNAMTIQVEETLLVKYINDNIENFIPLANKKQVSINRTISIDNNIKGYIDKSKITVILDNLISNAIKYTKQYGSVSINCSISGNKLNIEISDTGIGIAASEQKYIFNRFYRTRNAINSNSSGSGIGLLLTKRMVLLHKGSIRFVSKEGEFTKFYVNIPIDLGSYSPNEIIVSSNSNLDDVSVSTHLDIEEETSRDENKEKVKLLVVEDNDELRSYLVGMLSSYYNVFECASGEEALNSVSKIFPDFILSDVMMPGMSGVDLCKKLKSKIESCHIPIILLTALSEREDFVKGLNAGAEDYITKPFDPAILRSKIATIINNRLLSRSKYIDKTAFEEDSNDINSLDKEFMRSVIAHIEDQMMNSNYSIDQLALNMAMSRSVLFKKIKSLTTQSPLELIREIKMKRAATLLAEKHSIIEISYLVGFSNPKSFSTAFKKYYGVSPSEYMPNLELHNLK